MYIGAIKDILVWLLCAMGWSFCIVMSFKQNGNWGKLEEIDLRIVIKPRSKSIMRAPIDRLTNIVT